MSREAEKEYVSERILKNSTTVVQTLQQDCVIMICGSLSMQNDVMKVLDEICSRINSIPAAAFAEQEKILTDSY